MKTQGEIQSEISDLFTKFMQDNMGRGPTSIKTSITDDVVVVRLKGVLTETEKHLAISEVGKNLLVSVRRHLMTTTGKNHVNQIFLSKFKTSITNFYYDCDPTNNEEIVVCVMLSPMFFRIKTSRD
jgi:uncharacterized protein YbcI